MVTRIAPMTSEVSSARVMTRISMNATAATPASPIIASHHHCVMWVPNASLMKLRANRPISIVEPQPMAM